MSHQENIEIFVSCDVGQVVDWLSLVAGPVRLTETAGDMLVYETRMGSVFVTPGVGGSFVSVYMAAVGSPWSTDVECARQAASEIGCVVRCDPGRHHPGVHPASDTFLEIRHGAEALVEWHDDLDSGRDRRSLDEANAILGAHSLAGVRLASWTAVDGVARFEVFHVEWEAVVFGALVFHGVRYVQAPDRTSWGYRIRLAPNAVLPSRGDVDAADVVYELYSPDGAEPSAFVVAGSLEVQRVSPG